MPKAQPVVVSRGALWGTIVVAIIALLCIRLGIWQLQRLEQRRARNAATQMRMREPPLQLSALRDDTSGLIFRRVVLNGSYDDAHTVIIAGRSLRGVPGVHVLTPMLIGGAAVLVNRGWMPSADAARIEVDSIREPAASNLTALITPFPEDYGRPPATDAFHRVWFQMNGHQMRSQFPYREPVLPLIVQILPHTGQPLYPIRLKPPEMAEGPHLGYAIQWFSFATIAVVGWLILVRRRKREE
jgi:surfeit locus 1 family protein